MAYSVNPAFPSSSAQSLVDPREKIITMGCLCQIINNLFAKMRLDRPVDPLEFAKGLLKSKKEKTEEETKTALCASKYGSFFDKNTSKNFAKLLHKLPGSPIKEGLEYIKNAPGYDVIEGFQVPNDWKKNETVTLPQIYKEQFFAWILKNSELPFDTILLMFQILQSLDDPSIKLDGQVWNELSGKKKIVQRQLIRGFQSKYEFLIKNKFLQSFPLELKDIKVTCSIQKSASSQYRLWEKAVQRLIHKTADYTMTSNAGALDISGENLSDKMLTHRLKKILPFFQEHITNLIDLERITSGRGQLESAEEKLYELLEELRGLEGIAGLKRLESIEKERHKLQKIIDEQDTRECKPDNIKELSLINFLMGYMNEDIIGQRARSREEIEGLSIDKFDEMFEPERKHSKKVSKTQLRQNTYFSEEEELDQSSSSEEEELVKGAINETQPYVDKIQTYLENKEKNKQLNGCLSQEAEIYLQQVKPYLRQEVYDHLWIAVAALENMAQAIRDGRKHHILLGGRSVLIHCDVAVEQMFYQMLSRIPLKEADLNLNSHNLIYLAEKLEENTGIFFSEEEKKFLEEIRVLLYLRYPEDYRLYFTANKTTPPEAFSLLDKLSQPKISRGSLKEVVSFSFEKYCQTLEFIAQLSEAPIKGILDFRNKISRLESQLNDVLNSKPSEFFAVESPLTQKIDKAQQILNILDGLVHIKDFEDGWLLVAFNTIKSYLQIMKIALETPQESTRHSLQKFIQVETLLNMDKLFKHLFRAISILQLGEDNRAHDLKKFFPIIEKFYKKPLFEEDKKLLESINLGITHHYLHKGSNADLKKDYEHFLIQARALLSTDEGFTAVTANGEVSHKTLQEAEEAIMHKMGLSLDLFIDLLKPVVGEIKETNEAIEGQIQRLQIA